MGRSRQHAERKGQRGFEVSERFVLRRFHQFILTPNEFCRFRSLVFWLYADNDALHPRLDGRVDKMIEVSPLLSQDVSDLR